MSGERQRTVPPTIDEWMSVWMTPLKVIESRLHLGRFKEPIYYLTDPISWKPNPGQENG
jgi:hypothetical protein